MRYLLFAIVFCVEVIPTALHALRGIDYMVQAKLAEGRAQEAEQKLRGTYMYQMFQNPYELQSR